MDTVNIQIPKTVLYVIGLIFVALLAVLAFTTLATHSQLPFYRFASGIVFLLLSLRIASFLFRRAFLARPENKE